MRFYLILPLVLFVLTSGMGQGGAQLFVGATSLANTHVDITEAGKYQYGYSIGLQSRLKDGHFVAGPGFKYTRFSINASNDMNFVNQEESYHLFSLPFNLGLEYRLAFLWKLRIYGGGDLHYVWKIDDNKRNINFNYINDYFFGAHAGIGVDFTWVTLDLTLEKGMSDAHRLEESKYNWVSLSLGFFF